MLAMRLRMIKKLTKIEQALFGLPWIAATALLACQEYDCLLTTHWTQWALIIVAFSSARTSGMAFNRLIDRDIDAANPRTQERVLPAGEATVGQVTLVAWTNVAIFVFACGMINTLCLSLSPLAVTLLWVYSYTKRFTPLCHLVLGGVHFFSVIFAWAAMAGSLSLPPVLLGLAALASIAGMDIIYACQDYEFDAGHGLHSIPVLMGPPKALVVARGLHLIAILLLWSVGQVMQLSPPFFGGIAAVACLYGYYHRKIDVECLHKINRAFFGCTTAVGAALLVGTIGAVVWNASL